MDWRGWQKGPFSLKPVPHILQWLNLAKFTLSKEDPKIFETRDTPTEFCRHQHFFTRNQQILLYQEIQIQITFWYTISNSFNFFWLLLKIILTNMVANTKVFCRNTKSFLRQIQKLYALSTSAKHVEEKMQLKVWTTNCKK